MLHELIHIDALSFLTSEGAVVKLYVKFEAFPPMSVPSLISEYGTTLLALESSIVEHVFHHVDYSDFFMLIAAVRALPVASALPFVDATFAGEHLALATTDHVDHHVPTNWANELVNYLFMLVDHIIWTQSFSIVTDFTFNNTLDFLTYVCDKLSCSFFTFLNPVNDW